MLLIYGWKYAGKSGVWFFFTSFLLYILSKSKSSFFGFYYSWNRNNCCWDSFSCLLTDDGNFVVRQLWTPFNIWLHKFSSLRCLRKSAYCALLIISYLDIREKRPKMAKKSRRVQRTIRTYLRLYILFVKIFFQVYSSENKHIFIQIFIQLLDIFILNPSCIIFLNILNIIIHRM